MKTNENIFAGHQSQCEKRQKNIVCAENAAKYEAHNVNRNLVRQYHIDGDVICSKQRKCDYLVLNDEKRQAYLVELKSSKIQHAIDQINDTEKVVKSSLPSYQFYYRIVYGGSATHNVHDSKVLKWKNQGMYKGKMIADLKRHYYEENI